MTSKKFNQKLIPVYIGNSYAHWCPIELAKVFVIKFQSTIEKHEL